MTTTLIRWINALLHRGPGYDLPNSETAALRTALTDLATRYEAIASRATTDVGRARAGQIRKAAEDIRIVLAAGRVPLYLLTDAELEAKTPASDAEIVGENA